MPASDESRPAATVRPASAVPVRPGQSSIPKAQRAAENWVDEVRRLIDENETLRNRIARLEGATRSEDPRVAGLTAEVARLRAQNKESSDQWTAKIAELQSFRDRWERSVAEAKTRVWPDKATSDAVVAAAKAEVRARGYRSSDMARALDAHSGNGWFYGEELPGKALCESTVTSEMDDGPLTLRCAKISGHVGDHRYGR